MLDNNFITWELQQAITDLQAMPQLSDYEQGKLDALEIMLELIQDKS